MKYKHVPVLLHEVVNVLNIKTDGIYIDGTFGRGGHSHQILSLLGKDGRLLAIDRDPIAIAIGKNIHDSRFTIVHRNFSTMAEYITELGLLGCIDGILLDLGVSSPQLDNPERGFSFKHDGPLDMRMDTTYGLSATKWLAQASIKDITWVLQTFGEERLAKRIAEAIFKQNSKRVITSTSELAQLIAKINKFGYKHKHPATRSFQAIRIYINNELNELQYALKDALCMLTTGGKLAVISFHSLEDRLVKNFIRQNSKIPQLPKGIALTEKQILGQYKHINSLKLKSLGKIKPSILEIRENPRARSALLRFAEKL